MLPQLMSRDTTLVLPAFWFNGAMFQHLDQNGIILSYTVTYKALPDGSLQSKVVGALTTQAILAGLNKYNNYSLTVFASTVKGDGNASVPIVVITDEDSK